MDLASSLAAIPLLLAAMLALSLIEALIPLRSHAWRRRRVGANLALTFLTFATNAALNLPLLLMLVWLQAKGFGLFNLTALPPLVEIAGAVLALDLAWYVTHRVLHQSPALWRFHAVHHSDAAVDVTTTIRQHPGESLVRYAFLAAFAAAAGASPAAFALYRVWSALHGMAEHANLRLPQRLDAALTWVVSSPNMHKVHHSRDARLTDTNYGNIFAVWDRLFGTFTPSRHGLAVDYGLDGHAADTTARELLAAPFAAAEASATQES